MDDLKSLRILFVCGETDEGTFTDQQAATLSELGVHLDFFRVRGRGAQAYVRSYFPLRRKIREGGYSLVHAHYGFSGLLATMQRLCPTVVTYLGCDVNVSRYRIASRICARLAAYRIVVEPSMAARLGMVDRYEVIPHGIDLDELRVLDKRECRAALRLDPDKALALFASSASRPEKNYKLARSAADLVPGLQLMELTGFSRPDFIRVLNAADLLVLTSLREGSPVVVKEALACNTPVVATDVGDVRALIGNVPGCHLTTFEAEDIASRMREVLATGRLASGRDAALRFDKVAIARRIIDLYRRVL